MRILAGALPQPDDAEPDIALFLGVFHRIGQEVEQDLVDPGLVPHQALVPDPRDLHMERLPLGLCHGPDDRVHGGDHIV